MLSCSWHVLYGQKPGLLYMPFQLVEEASCDICCGKRAELGNALLSLFWFRALGTFHRFSFGTGCNFAFVLLVVITVSG